MFSYGFLYSPINFRYNRPQQLLELDLKTSRIEASMNILINCGSGWNCKKTRG